MIETSPTAKTSSPAPPLPPNTREDFQSIRELSELLLTPVSGLLAGPSKKVRSGLLLASAGLCSRDGIKPETREQCRLLAEALETLHAGSLVIDDIQDQAPVRRRQPSLHEQLGVPLAINAGNWLYFKALQLIQSAQLAPELELRLYRLCHETLFEGHMGQALDVGVRIDEIEQSRVGALCLSAMAMKSGALTRLATEIGARAAGGPEGLIEALRDFGQSFGCALQMFNDLNEFTRADLNHNKDLFLRRPSWVWVVAADQLSAHDYAALTTLARSQHSGEDIAAMTRFLREKNLLEMARKGAEQKMRECTDKLLDRLHGQNLDVSKSADWQTLSRIRSMVETSHE